MAAVQVFVALENCSALSPGAPLDPSMVFEGAKCAPRAVMLVLQSSQYVPGGSVVLMLRVFLQMRRVVPGADPGGGATVLKIRKNPVSTEPTRRFVVVSPKITVPPAFGGPFQILSVAAVNGDVVGPPV